MILTAIVKINERIYRGKSKGLLAFSLKIPIVKGKDNLLKRKTERKKVEALILESDIWF